MTAPLQRRPGFSYSPMLPLGEDNTKYRKLDIEGISTIEVEGKTVLKVTEGALSELAFAAFHDISHLLRPAHLAQLAAILQDPEASENDRYVAMEFLKNAAISARGVLPMCQDTGTALIFGKKGQRVWVEG
ncbi:MAG: fumarate hydratase, partial [Rhodospirillales bacterium]|nr:fumarate hydratase [Rhodospirillales bacterium]